MRQLRSIRWSVSDPVLWTLVMALVRTKLDYGSATLADMPAILLDRLQSVLNAVACLSYRRQKFDHVSPLLKESRLRVTQAALAASARTHHLPVGSSCLLMSAQHGAALPHRAAPTGEQRWLPAASTFIVVSHARCSLHQTRDHRWPCIQLNCSSCVEQSVNSSAVF